MSSAQEHLKKSNSKAIVNATNSKGYSICSDLEIKNENRVIKNIDMDVAVTVGDTENKKTGGKITIKVTKYNVEEADLV